VKQVIIIAKLWLDREAYHSVQVFDGKRKVGRIFDRGDNFLQDAHDLLQSRQVFNGDFQAFRDDIRQHKDRYRIVCNQVASRLDL
jgi:hypothetical protein